MKAWGSWIQVRANWKALFPVSEGTGEIQEATSGLPGQMQQEADNIMAEYDKSDFQAESFVSPENDNIGSVQFVFQTESIEWEETEVAAEPVEEEKTFWTRLMDFLTEKL